QDQVELGTEIADRVVIAGELLGRRQRTQYFADFGERALDAGQRLLVDAALSVIVDAARQRADFALDRFDGAAGHRFGDGVTDFSQFAAECGNRLLDAVGALQRLDLARDLEQMALERGKIRTRRNRRRRHGRCDRRGADRRQRPRRTIEFVLARSDFRDRGIERDRARRRRGAIDMACGALDRLGLALLVGKLGVACVLRIRNLRQPRIQARDGIVQLPGDTLLAAGRFAARGGTGNLFDLACDRVKPLMDVGDIARFPARRRLHRDAEIRRGGITDGRSEPVVQRHPGATRRGLGALAYGWIDTVNTPRYARIHASVRFRRSGAPPCAFSLPARPTDETIEFRAGRLPQL